MITKALLIQRLLIDKVSQKDLARELGVHRNTIAKYCNEFKVNYLDYWKYRPIICNNCRHEIDSERELDEKKRKFLLAKPRINCSSCRIEIARANNCERQMRFKNKNKDYTLYEARMKRIKKKEEAKLEETV